MNCAIWISRCFVEIGRALFEVVVERREWCRGRGFWAGPGSELGVGPGVFGIGSGVGGLSELVVGERGMFENIIS